MRDNSVQWRHSSFSLGAEQTCVDVAFHGSGVLVRDSKDPNGPVLRFTAREWTVFLLGIRNNEFELPPRAGRLRQGKGYAPQSP